MLTGGGDGESTLEGSVRATEMLLVVNAWALHGRSIARTAKALRTSRRRVRGVLERWRAGRGALGDPTVH